jgi:phage terminase large subunit-like protein
MSLTAFADDAPDGWRGAQRPRLLHLPSGTALTAQDALYLLGEWGLALDEWQRFVLTGALLEGPDGRWSAKEVGVEVPRQNGKGELLEARALVGLFLLDEVLLIHSAHEFATATEALERMDARIDANPDLKKLCKPVRRSHGEEGVYRKNGQRLRYRTRTKGGGRGFTADWLALDEAMFIAESFHGALMPTVSAVPNPQIWYTGSAVDQESMDHGVVFARVRERAIEGTDERLAYFGWSPAYDRPSEVPLSVAQDPGVWAVANPALGIRIDPDHVALEQRSMDHRTFCVERLGVGDWPRVSAEDGGVISVKQWLSLVDPSSEPTIRWCSRSMCPRTGLRRRCVSLAGARTG